MLEVGIDLDDLIGTPADPGRWIFVRDPSASATLEVTADNLNATARFGFLSVEVVGGSAEIEPTFTLSLSDPGTHAADGRIDLGELLDALGGVDLDFGGEAYLALPIEADFLGIEAGPDTTLEIIWSDLSDPDTLEKVFQP